MVEMALYGLALTFLLMQGWIRIDDSIMHFVSAILMFIFNSLAALYDAYSYQNILSRDRDMRKNSSTENMTPKPDVNLCGIEFYLSALWGVGVPLGK